MADPLDPAKPVPSGAPGEVFSAFLKLGLTSFGGPIAHLGYFREELVVRRRWIDDRGYAELLALCQFLPGPASSQAGFALGLPVAGEWVELLNTDATAYGGSGVGNLGVVHARAAGPLESGAPGGSPAYADLVVPPLATVWLRAPVG